MDASNAKNLIVSTFEHKFDKVQFRKFIINFLDGINEGKSFDVGNAQVKEAYRKNILSYSRIGQYTDKNGNIIDVLIVHVNDNCSLDRSRTMLRNFVADYMRQRQKDTALVAFYKDSAPDWRFSFVKLEMSLQQDEKGKVKVVNEFTPAKRYSYLVGEMEPNHTAQSRLINLLIKDYPTLEEIEEAFNVEKVSKEFFANYKELFLQLVDNLKEIRKNEPSQRINTEFTLRQLTEANFCKKLLGQLVFLYFIQKKGWLGVPKGANWGEGDKQFLRHTFERAVNEGKNFFNDYLEPLFYNALANGERDDQLFDLLDCKIPFLNGGLFEPINGYDWVNTDIVFNNDIFSNANKTKAGDIGDGILDVFDRYNFTVKEDEPLEKEVAVDPEMLGKVFEELLEVQDRKSKGAFYTPREIVHYMCQESLINYLTTELGASEEEDNDSLTKNDIAEFIHHSDKFSERENIATKKENPNSKYTHILSESIRNNAEKIDKALETIKICDPAIGSGAFPVGMLNEIVRARIALVESGFLKETKKRSVYEYKRQAIQNSIYGVDIESGAVEIAKLRLWLSLVVEEDDITNIKALPNLDYKIVCGNSLLNVPRTLFNDSLFRKLEELKPQFFDETRKGEKRRLKKEIDAIIEELTKDGTFDFEIFFSEVFHEKGGFDVVIANPPYFNVQTFGAKHPMIDYLKKNYSEIWMDKSDILFYFIHKAYQISKRHACFIISNAFLFSDKAKKLRNFLLDKMPISEIVNFEKYMVFGSALITSCIVSFDKQYKNKKTNIINFKEEKLTRSEVELTLQNKIKSYQLTFNKNDVFSLQEENIQLLKNKIDKHTELLGAILKIGKGMETAANNVFLFDTYPTNFPEEFIKNRISGEIMYKYKIGDTNEYLLYFEDIDSFEELPSVIKNHLLENKDFLSNRADKKRRKTSKWWNYTFPMHKEYYKYDKIWCSYRAKNNVFVYDNTKNYIGLTNMVAIFDTNPHYQLKYILALLNSKLLDYRHKISAKQTGGGIYEYVPSVIEKFPIKKVDKTTQDRFVIVVDKILDITQSKDYLENQEKQDTVKDYEKQIDLMVYKLYDLTYEEVKSIDKDFSLSEEKYLAFNDVTSNVN